MKLPRRLLAIARFIPKGRKVADIGTDHAILPVYLVREKISPEVIASDLNEGPLEAAAKTVVQSDVANKIQLRLGYGLNTINSGEVDIAVIAGMGGGTIKNILEECKDRYPVSSLVLQPMGDSGYLRQWLAENGWKIADEDIIEEDGRLYEIIFSVRGHEETTNELILFLGPRLVEKEHPFLIKLIEREIEANRKIAAALKESKKPEALLKQQLILERNKSLECFVNDSQMPDDN